MIKFVRQKNRENTLRASKNFMRKKRESNDSGTESDGELLDVENQRHLDVEMETSVAGQKPIAPEMMCHQQTSSCAHLMYDQHSSEEELEVINGPSSQAGQHSGGTAATGSSCASRISNRGCTSSLDTEAPYEERATTSNSKRSSSTLMVENRKRSLAHSSDDELRNSLEPILTPVNFRTSPPLEAFKPNRSHMMFRSTTPLILSEARCGIENIKLCDNSVNEENGDNGGGGGGGGNGGKCAKIGAATGTGTGNGGNENEPSVIKACSSSLKMSNSSHHIYQPQPKYSFHYNSSRSSPASTTGLDMEVRSVSPPAKLFHCAISPRRRPSSNATTTSPPSSASASASASAAATATTTTHNAANVTAVATQRLQRPHRPCLDFDKMQQVSL
ncbi:pneumococcal serine-rich repeat protein isoform X1 [Drosophila biarmipes]|uniref:pneumococcal serine-rich repeat protein isoform X1 n=2 Tax=Drosophila biarmipes TaxID=125945 RepID=UPI0007E88235|nr:pneumococcal serine-rich repeat protein isoform X1 [Drosophila biarmipes]